MPDEPHKNALHLVNTHIHAFHHTPVQHPRWDVPTTTLLLQFFEAPEDDSFTMGETVLHIWQIITTIMVRHMRFFPRLSAEDIATMSC
jgi:hypothetical protein